MKTKIIMLKENMHKFIFILLLCGLLWPMACKRTGGDDHEANESKSDHDHLHADEQTAQQIKWQKPQRRFPIRLHEMTGVIVVNQNSSEWVTAGVSGRVKSMKADIADRVRTGDELMVIDSAELLTLKESYISSSQVLRKSRAASNRGRVLAEQQGIEAKTVLERETQFRIDQAQHFSSRAALLRLGLDAAQLGRVVSDTCSEEELTAFLCSDLIISAPLSGVVMERHVEVGEWVTADKSLQRIADPDSVWGVFNATLMQAAQLNASAEIDIRIQGEKKNLYKGRIDLIYPQLDPQTRMLPLRILISNPDGHLRPGLFAGAQLRWQEPNECLLVDGQAHTLINGIGGVFLHEGDGFRFQPLAKADFDGEGFLIVPEAWKEFEIVTAGAFDLKAKMLLQSGAADPHAGHAH